MIKVIRSFVKDETGATAIEYGLIAALVALVGVVAFTALGDTIVGAFDDIAAALCEGTGGTYTESVTGGGEVEAKAGECN